MNTIHTTADKITLGDTLIGRGRIGYPVLETRTLGHLVRIKTRALGRIAWKTLKAWDAVEISA